jgi:serine/threonine protein kinase
VGLIAWNLQAERPFLVFELAHGGTLGDEIRSVRGESGTYHPLRALQRIREVLRALSQVHDRGLVHCDVKPANLLRFGDTIKLADFGAGHSLGPAAAFRLDTFVGTRRYASPEQIEGTDIDQRTDLYSVGCILHEMLTGEAPEAPMPRAAKPRYPNALVLPELDALLGSLLAGDKTVRPADTREAIDRVDLALRSYESVRRTWTRLGLGPSPY